MSHNLNNAVILQDGDTRFCVRRCSKVTVTYDAVFRRTMQTELHAAWLDIVVLMSAVRFVSPFL